MRSTDRASVVDEDGIDHSRELLRRETSPPRESKLKEEPPVVLETISLRSGRSIVCKSGARRGFFPDGRRFA